MELRSKTYSTGYKGRLGVNSVACNWHLITTKVECKYLLWKNTQQNQKVSSPASSNLSLVSTLSLQKPATLAPHPRVPLQVSLLPGPLALCTNASTQIRIAMEPCQLDLCLQPTPLVPSPLPIIAVHNIPLKPPFAPWAHSGNGPPKVAQEDFAPHSLQRSPHSDNKALNQGKASDGLFSSLSLHPPPNHPVSHWDSMTFHPVQDLTGTTAFPSEAFYPHQCWDTTLQPPILNKSLPISDHSLHAPLVCLHQQVQKQYQRPLHRFLPFQGQTVLH